MAVAHGEQPWGGCHNVGRPDKTPGWLRVGTDICGATARSGAGEKLIRTAQPAGSVNRQPGVAARRGMPWPGMLCGVVQGAGGGPRGSGACGSSGAPIVQHRDTSVHEPPLSSDLGGAEVRRGAFGPPLDKAHRPAFSTKGQDIMGPEVGGAAKRSWPVLRARATRWAAPTETDGRCSGAGMGAGREAGETRVFVAKPSPARAGTAVGAPLVGPRAVFVDVFARHLQHGSPRASSGARMRARARVRGVLRSGCG